jgi:hypothetical protein
MNHDRVGRADGAAPGQALLDWLEQVDEGMGRDPLEDLRGVRTKVEGRARAIEQLAGLIAESRDQAWPIERLAALRERTVALAARVRRIREEACQEFSRYGRDRRLAGALEAAAAPAAGQVDCVG